MQGTMSNQAKADRRELPGAAGRRGDAKFRDLSGARLAGCNMAGLDLSGACLRGADLRDAI
jgi:uncharacterized protein YjbI with pentapeptide repeats